MFEQVTHGSRLRCIVLDHPRIQHGAEQHCSFIERRQTVETAFVERQPRIGSQAQLLFALQRILYRCDECRSNWHVAAVAPVRECYDQAAAVDSRRATVRQGTALIRCNSVCLQHQAAALQLCRLGSRHRSPTRYSLSPTRILPARCEWQSRLMAEIAAGLLGFDHVEFRMSEEKADYVVVVNHEDQYSVWPAGREPPAGWKSVGQVGSKDECLAWIDAHWTDMTPLSLRRALATTSSHADVNSTTNQTHFGGFRDTER